MIVTYRVFHEASGQLTIRELFCEHNGRVITYGSSPVALRGGSVEELTQEIDVIKAALMLPILTTTEIDAEIAAQAPKPTRNRKTITHAELMTKLGLNMAGSNLSNDIDIPVLVGTAN